MDARFGTDQRQLRSDRACPCILHSYGSVLAACPCGCRSRPFSPRRLERDGISRDQLQPYLQGTESLILGGLGILTTAPVRIAAQGPLPVINLRIPAIFKPTGEAILIEGSLIQLGGQTIHRVSDAKMIQIEELPTVVLKISVFRDEWPHSWESFIPSPVKAILGYFPAFVLCRGVNCGDGRNKYHQPVDAELGPVIKTDVWNRLWLSLRGKKMPAAEADLFQVYFRTPHVCLSTLHWLSRNAGLYVEPRSVDGRNADQSMAVIWLPGATLARRGSLPRWRSIWLR